jgi:uncharacterized protein YacL
MNSVFKFLKKKTFNSNDLRYNTFGLIFLLIQSVIGTIYLFTSFSFELLLIKKTVYIITPVLLVFLGWSLHKRQFESRKKFFRIILFYGTGLLLMSISNIN